MMRKYDILTRYGKMSDEERAQVDIWVKGSFVISSIFGGGILMMAWGGSGLSISPDKALATPVKPAVVKAFERTPKSALELMSNAPLDLPVQPVDVEPF